MTNEPALTTRYSPSRYSTSARPSGRSSRSILFMQPVYPAAALKQTVLFVARLLRALFRLRCGWPLGHGRSHSIGKSERECLAAEHGFGATPDFTPIAAHQHKSALEHGAERDAIHHSYRRSQLLAELPQSRTLSLDQSASERGTAFA